MGQNWLISSRKILKKIFVTKSVIILPKFNRKLAENRLILGPKKPAGLSGFGDRASGGLGLPKNGFGRAGFGLSPRPATSLFITLSDGRGRWYEIWKGSGYGEKSWRWEETGKNTSIPDMEDDTKSGKDPVKSKFFCLKINFLHNVEKQAKSVVFYTSTAGQKI